MKILGIETSCDETAASVVEDLDGEIKVLSNVVLSQIEIHKKYGGVVPEVAAREHVLTMMPVVHEALSDAKGKGAKNVGIDAIAVTIGPGLVTSLLAGVETAKALAYAWDLPVVGVNHIEGHIAANFVSSNDETEATRSEQVKKIELPAVILTVSGGHTTLLFMETFGKYKTIGQTRDDAVGEAFDKVAKLMGLGYPGGEIISAEAEKFLTSNFQFPDKAQTQNSKNQTIKFPRPMIDSANFDFSFSGLKTAVRYALEADENWQERMPEYCAEFQQAVIDVLVKKTIKAGLEFKAKTVMLAGGVSANKELRRQLEKAVLKNKLKFRMPDLKYTTDNAVMIAVAGCLRARNKEFVDWKDLQVDCNLDL